jgi:LysM repeat protein
VRPGDSPWRIAIRFGISLNALLAANGFSANVIVHPGQVVVIPGGGSPTSGVVAPPSNPAPAPAAVSQPGLNHLGSERVVLADYMLWYDPSTFDGSKTWDVPSSGAYNSSDFGTIQRHVAQAQQACLNGFAAHWYGPSEGTTTGNFNQLLAASAGTNLRHAVVIQANVLGGASEQSIADAVRFALDQWANSPNYLRLGGRPLLLFTDMPRPWGSDAAALQGWTRIRASVDPEHKSIWMAEGLSPTYSPLFDGLYVYRIDHRDYPQSWLKQPRWAAGLRALETRRGLPLGGLYFADTIAPGFDDTRSVNIPSDNRSSAPHFARDRRGGGYFADTFAVTAKTGGDFLLVKSFNEWVEGTQIEPGNSYGDLYLNLTCQYANEYRGR